ncbi:MAG: o-succinylbenzoate--CoA ligase [Dehalococcoidia bacterium]|nr:o-succinylbenzoate--CoA ligase [Dehalococcoidia bacterium]
MDRLSVEASPGLLPEFLAQRALIGPGRDAIIAGRTRWSFSDLYAASVETAEWLASLGVGPGDRVAALLPNGPGYAAIVHAMARLDATLAPLNTRLTAFELDALLEEVDARVLVYGGACDAIARALGTTTPVVETLRLADDGGDPALPQATNVPLVDLSAVHTIVHTSGTTGRSKGAMLTYGNHFWSAVGSVLNLGLRDDDRWLAVLPFFHVGGLSILMRSVIYGIPVVVHESFDPAAANRAIDEEQVTIVSVVSIMLQRMLDERGLRPYPETFRCALLGGGPAPRGLLEECRRRGVPVVQTYGLTETASQVVTLAPQDAVRELGSAGKPLFPAQVRIEADGGDAAVDQVGEIVVRGPMVTPGYFHRPEATAQALSDGWLHTGDLGYLDADGYLYVVDRRDDLIIRGGENVYPAEVESAILTHPAVAEAGVVGVADARWGQSPLAFVVLRPAMEAGAEEVISFCSERLARYKVPVAVRFVDALPRTAAGKLRRGALRDTTDG